MLLNVTGCNTVTVTAGPMCRRSIMKLFPQIVILWVVVLLFAAPGFTKRTLPTLGLSTENCGCQSDSSKDLNETTQFGGNQLIKTVEKKTYKFLHGTINDVNGKAVPEALVEIFDNPDWIKSDESRSAANQTRLRVCKTGKSGKFCFKGLRTGKYELRVSKDIRWNPSHIYIAVNPEDKNA